MTGIITPIILYYIIFSSNHVKSISGDDYCYMKDTNPYMYFASRTAYEPAYAKNMSTPPDCNIFYIWALVRHGTRYGGTIFHRLLQNKTAIAKNQIIENHEVYKRGKLCIEDLQNLKKWKNQWNKSQPMDLTAQGVEDMRGIAARLKAKFGTFFDDFQNKFLIETSTRRRCQQSSVAFTNELFHTSYQTIVGNDIVVSNELSNMAFGNISNIEELAKFVESGLVGNMIEEVTDRLGYNSTLSFKNLTNLYDICGYENAWSPHTRPAFCVAFTVKHLKILEYYEDLIDFYEIGYGNQTAKTLACPIVQDLYTKLIDAGKTLQPLKKGTFYFGHMESLLSTFVILGLFQDRESIKHDNYELLSDRKWRISYNCPFAANLFVILFKCIEGFKIVFYNNEKLVPIPGCPSGICSMEKFQEIFEKKILKQCSPSSSSIIITAWSLPVIIIFTFCSIGAFHE